MPRIKSLRFLRNLKYKMNNRLEQLHSEQLQYLVEEDKDKNDQKLKLYKNL